MSTAATNIFAPPALIVVAGLAGSGKSSAIDVISDLGYFRIDNLPFPLLSSFLDLARRLPQRYERVVLLPDIDSSQNLLILLELLDKLELEGSVRVARIFLDASTAVIIRRYGETRRPHPVFNPARDQTLAAAIQREREMLMAFKERATLIVNTTELTVHDLKRTLKEFVESLGIESRLRMRVNFLSFGFKYGVPIDCDLIMDVRFLPNPHFIDELRPKTGLDEPVAKYVLGSSQAAEFMNRYVELPKFLLPRYAYEGKSFLNIGIGCTGGKHRSVAIAEELLRSMNSNDYLVSVKHRDHLR